MKKFYSFIEEDYFEHDFQNIQKQVQEDDSYFGIFGNHKVNSKINNSISDWKEIMSSKIADNILNKYTWYFNVFNYEI